MKVVIGLVLAACCVAVVACGAASKQSAAMPIAPTDAHATDPRGEIERLSAQIDEQMGRAHVESPASPACSGAACAQALSAIRPVTPRNDPACHPAATDACASSCDLSDSICKNADRICVLANDMPGDDWAANKCRTARESCSKSNESCCTCML